MGSQRRTDDGGARHWPLVTIIIPTYNQERFIARAIESALAQEYRNLEILVSDDCSTDDTFAIASRFAGGNVRVTRTAQNIGRVANYRRGLYEFARGDWVVNLDGDDFYDDPSFLTEAVTMLANEPETVMYAAGSKALNDATGAIEFTPMAFRPSVMCMTGVDFVLAYPRLGATQHFSVLYNRLRALETGFYVLDSLGTDTDSLLRLALGGKVIVHKKYVGVWTHHDRNASYAFTDDDVNKEIHMLAHVAEALSAHVPTDVAEAWFDRQVEEKRRFVVNLTLQKLPLDEAWRYYLRKVRPDYFFGKEGAKLLLRTIGAR